jgi:amino acid permease
VLEVFGFLGIGMFTFEGSAVVLNIRAEAKNPKSYPKILYWSVFTATMIFMVLATICYFCYREDTNEIITMNFMPEGYTTVFIKVTVCYNALCSYPL